MDLRRFLRISDGGHKGGERKAPRLIGLIRNAWTRALRLLDFSKKEPATDLWVAQTRALWRSTRPGLNGSQFDRVHIDRMVINLLRGSGRSSVLPLSKRGWRKF